jgi:hypothetical protein
MTERAGRAIPPSGPRRDHQRMHRRHLEVLDSYELIARPVVTSTRLAYVPWVQEALQPYGATQLPSGPTQGLWEALQRARLAAAPQPEAPTAIAV